MKKRLCFGAVVALMVCGPPAHASVIGPLFTIQARNELGAAQLVIDQPLPTDRSSSAAWVLPEPIDLTTRSGNVVATLMEASFVAIWPEATSRVVTGPTVVLNFLVTSAAGGAFIVTSANLSFPAISPAQATATAAATVTDFNGAGATLTGNFPGGDTYRAFYNDPGNVSATGTPFTSLLGGLSAGAYQSDSANPNSGPFAPVGVPVSNISSQWKFNVGAGDSASGTSTFVVIPTPGGAALALIAFGLAIARRRPVWV